MKSDRRHQLQQNDLAAWISGHSQNIEKYVKIGVGVLLLGAAVSMVSATLSRRAKARAATSWREFRLAASEQDIEGLRDLAVKFPGTESAGWGLQTAADITLASGSMAMFGDREIAMERLKAARDDFQSALTVSKSVNSEFLKRHALMGFAQASESLGEFDDAKQAYEEVVTAWPSLSIAEDARDRLEFLSQSSTEEFYQWFVEQEIQLPPPIRPRTDGQIERPSVYGDLPKDDDFRLPGLDSLDGGGLSNGPSLTPPDAANPQSETSPEDAMDRDAPFEPSGDSSSEKPAEKPAEQPAEGDEGDGATTSQPDTSEPEQPAADAGADSATEPDPEPKTEPDPEPEPKPDPEPDPEPKPDPEPEPDPDPDPEPEPKPDPEPVADSASDATGQDGPSRSESDAETEEDSE